MAEADPPPGPHAPSGPVGEPLDPGPGEPQDETSRPRVRRAGLVLGPGLALALLLWPDLPLDGPQRRAAAVTAWTATWWITLALPVGATSLLPAVLLPLLGVMTAGEVAPTYMGDLVLLFLGAFVVALGLERWGVHRRIALRILSLFGTSPRSLVLGFMCAAAFLSLWINNTATTLLMLPIAGAVLERSASRGPGGVADGGASAESQQRFAWCLMLGVAYCASVGGMGTPVGTAPNQVYLGQLVRAFPDAPRPGFGPWLLGWGLLVVLFVPLAWLLMTRVIFRLPAGGGEGAEVVRAARRAQGPMGPAQMRMAAVFAVTALLWVTRSDLVLGPLHLPGWARAFVPADATTPEAIAAHMRDVSDSTVALAMALVCFVLPAGGGERGNLMDWRTAARLPWDVLLLLGAGFCLAASFKATGLDVALGQALAPLFEGRSSWLVVAAVALSVSFLTEVTSNTATTSVLLPVLGAAGAQAGLDPRLVMVPAALAASAAFMLPVATPPNAVVFASRRVGIPQMVRGGFWLNLMTVVLLTLVFQLWVRRLWGIGEVAPAWAQP